MSIQAITRDIPPMQGEVSSVTNGSDSISTTQNVVESATSSNTQATSQKASRVRRCWDRMTAVFCCNTSRADVALSNNVSIENVALIGSAVQNNTDLLALCDVVHIQEVMWFASRAKRFGMELERATIASYLGQHPIGCMTVLEAKKFAQYICKISEPNRSLSMKNIDLRILLADPEFPDGFTMKPEVYNVLPGFVKDELYYQLDVLISEYQCATATDKTLVEIKAQGLSDQEFAIAVIHKLNKVTQELLIDYRTGRNSLPY